MTTRQFYSEYWKPLLLTIIPTVLITGFATFMSVKVALAVHAEKINHNLEQVKENKKDISDLKRDCAWIKGTLGITTTRGDS